MRAKSAAVLLILAATTLAGCTSSGSGSFTIDAPAEPGGAYTFKADVPGDNFTWDMGDRLTTLYGKTVSHTYDVTHGVVDVKLVAKKGTSEREYHKTIDFGGAPNGLPTLFLDVSSNWLVPGEAVRVSAAASTDPDGDALRFAFGCVLTGPIIKQAPGHVHVAPPAKVPLGAVNPRVSPVPIGAPDRVVQGDLCEALETPRPSLDATLEGTFSKPGVYDIYLFGGDASMAPVAGKITVYVTEASDRPGPVDANQFTGTLTGGNEGQASDGLGTVPLPPGTIPEDVILDRATHTFGMPLDNQLSYVNLTYTRDPLGATKVRWAIMQESRTVATGGGDAGDKLLLAADTLKRGGTYTLEVVLVQGANVEYSVDVVNILNRDPTRLF